ncbi:hypothetical protein CAP48_04775 [Advenella sp. S44]|nr:hypothetical protein CAP48_04775 [Advenella sp. S44]
MRISSVMQRLIRSARCSDQRFVWLFPIRLFILISKVQVCIVHISKTLLRDRIVVLSCLPMVISIARPGFFMQSPSITTGTNGLLHS